MFHLCPLSVYSCPFYGVTPIMAKTDKSKGAAASVDDKKARGGAAKGAEDGSAADDKGGAAQDRGSAPAAGKKGARDVGGDRAKGARGGR